MDKYIKGKWIADITKMTCKNTTNNIVVIFEKLGIDIIGKIKKLPLDLISKWTVERNIELNIKITMREAEEIFMNEYFQSKQKTGNRFQVLTESAFKA